ncbi:hypothetical protein NC652_002968 [Populus alba x Populus x berolinensis]|nr:hypothetical protein NC652_002968 [Populus alba x Populus x berolinensis]
MDYDSLSRCLGGEMVDTRDSKSRVKERGDLLLNWNKFGCRSQNLDGLLYLMNNEWGVCSEIVRHGPTPESISSTGITQGAYPKENLVLLGREYLNRMNRPVDIFASEQKNEN